MPRQINIPETHPVLFLLPKDLTVAKHQNAVAGNASGWMLYDHGFSRMSGSESVVCQYPCSCMVSGVIWK